MQVFKSLSSEDRGRLFFNHDPDRRKWIEGLMSRMINYYEDDKDEDYEDYVSWVFAYGLFLYSKQGYHGRHAAMACICLACKQLDDCCPEIGSGDYEGQIPSCTGTKLASVEKRVLRKLDYRTLASRQDIEEHLMRKIVASGLVSTI